MNNATFRNYDARLGRGAKGGEKSVIELDGFDALNRIGAGGFSTVYRARQVGFGRTVAVKVLEGGIGNESQRESFEREVKAMGVVSQHPHIVTVLTSAYSAGGRPCIVMEYFQEGTLAEQIERVGALEPAEVLDMGIKLASALQTAHDRGILHQDVKPQNIFLSEFGQPALGDFGISSILGDRVSDAGGLTLHYAAPERILKRPAAPSSDLYSLAASLYRAVAGRRPFDHRDLTQQQTAQELARRVLDEQVPRLDANVVSPHLQDALLKALEKHPDDRHRSALEFAQHLRAVQRRLGLAPTPLIIQGAKPETIDFDLDTSSDDAHALATRFEDATTSEPPTGLDGSDATGKQAATASRTEPSTGRRAVAALLGVVAIAAVAGGLIWAFDRSPPAPETPPVPRDLPGVLRRPIDVTVQRTSPDLVEVTWHSDETEVTYEVERVDGDATDEPIVQTDAARVELSASDDETVCVVVRSIGPLGRISDDSDLVCLNE